MAAAPTYAEIARRAAKLMRRHSRLKHWTTEEVADRLGVELRATSFALYMRAGTFKRVGRGKYRLGRAA